MATSPNRFVTDTIRDDFLTCNICLEVFTDPQILPCLHTFCSLCITAHVNAAKANSRPVQCPSCRYQFSEKSLKNNFFIQGLTDLVREKTADITKCTACELNGRHSEANTKCLTCGDQLCTSCSDGHNASSLTWQHEKIPLADIKQGKYDARLRLLKTIKCRKHGDKNVDFFCDTCSKSLCQTCVLLHHRDHNCQVLSEAVEAKKSNIIVLTDELRKEIQYFENEEQKIEGNINALRESTSKEKQDIETKAQREIDKINAQKKTKLDKISQQSEKAQNVHEAKLKNVKLLKDNLISCIKFGDKILQEGKDEEVLMLEPLVKDRMKFLQTFNKGTCTYKIDQPESNAAPEQVKDIPSNMSSELSEAHSSSTKEKNESRTAKKVSLTKVCLYSVLCPTDSVKPQMTGMAFSSSVGLVISDAYNKKLKVFGMSGELKYEITAPSFKPFAVAIAGDVIGAISENYLYLFSPKGVLKRKIRISDFKPYPRFTYSLAADQTVGFVIGNFQRGLHFYSLNGNYKRYLNCFVSLPLAGLSVTPTGDLVLSEWGSSRIKVMSPDGVPRFTVEGKSWWPNGTCSSKDGTIFIAEFVGHCVSVFSRDGEHILDLNTTLGGVSKPTFVTFCEEDMLYVGNSDGKVCVYKVQKFF